MYSCHRHDWYCTRAKRSTRTTIVRPNPSPIPPPCTISCLTERILCDTKGTRRHRNSTPSCPQLQDSQGLTLWCRVSHTQLARSCGEKGKGRRRAGKRFVQRLLQSELHRFGNEIWPLVGLVGGKSRDEAAATSLQHQRQCDSISHQRLQRKIRFTSQSRRVQQRPQFGSREGEEQEQLFPILQSLLCSSRVSISHSFLRPQHQNNTHSRCM
jgi:hypothetical protein